VPSIVIPHRSAGVLPSACKSEKRSKDNRVSNGYWVCSTRRSYNRKKETVGEPTRKMISLLSRDGLRVGAVIRKKKFTHNLFKQKKKRKCSVD
jgi:hypothetical protein